MDAENLSLRLEALEASVAEYVVADLSRWQAVHARITAYEIAVELMCNVAQRRDPTLVRDLIEGLVFVRDRDPADEFPRRPHRRNPRHPREAARAARGPRLGLSPLTRRSRGRHRGKPCHHTRVTSLWRDWALSIGRMHDPDSVTRDSPRPGRGVELP